MFLKRATYNADEFFVYAVDNSYCIDPGITREGNIRLEYNPDTNTMLLSIISKKSIATARIQIETNTINIEEMSFTRFENHVNDHNETMFCVGDNIVDICIFYTIDNDNNEFTMIIKYAGSDCTVYKGTFVFNIEHK